ncbi:MAG: N5-glutamine methyltransferase family protein, partial [Planctomycetota bacterium]
ASTNAELNAVADRVEFRHGSLLEPVTDHERFGQFDWLLSNPPYIADHEWSEVDRNVRDYEPVHALRAGPRGLDVLEPLIEACHEAVRPGGAIAIEIGAHQGDAVRALAESNPSLISIEILKDHEGFDRVLIAHRRSD